MSLTPNLKLTFDIPRSRNLHIRFDHASNGPLIMEKRNFPLWIFSFSCNNNNNHKGKNSQQQATWGAVAEAKFRV